MKQIENTILELSQEINDRLNQLYEEDEISQGEYIYFSSLLEVWNKLSRKLLGVLNER